MAGEQYYATGRRKTATARVYLRPGNGAMVINHRAIDQYFHTDALKRTVAEAVEGEVGPAAVRLEARQRGKPLAHHVEALVKPGAHDDAR